MCTADVCPVGALETKDFHHKVRVWFLEDVATVCPGCSNGCNIMASTYKNRIWRLFPRRNDEVNETWMCDAGRLSYHMVGDPERLKTPMIAAEGGLTATDWNTAVGHAATTLISQLQMSEPQRLEMYAVVDEESARLDRLIGQAIEMAQLDSASIHVQAKPESVREIIALALEEAHPLLGERPVDVSVPQNMPPVRLDRKLVRRVLRHLIENAAKYSPPASPLRIGSRIEDQRLLVNVEDSGPGIEAFEQPLIFNKFYRGRNQKAAISGTGMGLAIVKAILVAHGGGIEVVSRPPRGALFTFWLPLASGESNDSV